jgi:hypothetical protein
MSAIKNPTIPSPTEAARPRLWIKRLAIFESSQMIKNPIRDIVFHRGLNIVWGVELPDDAEAESAQQVTLSGHSVGKTTLCRLMRYCLGESNFGNQGALSRIRNAFPEGWVGMHLEVEGQDWVVLWSIGLSGDSRAAAGSSIEDLLNPEHKKNHFSDYMNHLRATMMSGLQVDTPPYPDRPFYWKHLLAWLTRDQEARFQSLHDWRSSRSDSDALLFKNPKEDPLYLIRQILGLVNEQELRTARSLEAAKREYEQRKRQISELKQEPEYRLNEQNRILLDLLGISRQNSVLENDQGNNGIFSMEYQVDQRCNELKIEIARLDTRIEEIISAEIQLRSLIDGEEEELGRICAEVEVMLKATERPANAEVPKELDAYEKRREEICQLGRIRYSNCGYFQKRLMELKNKILNLPEERQQAFVQSGSEERSRFIEDLEGKQHVRSQNMELWHRQLTEYRSQRNDLEFQRKSVMVNLQRLEYHLPQWKSVLALKKGEIPNTELNREMDLVEKLRQRIGTLENDLQKIQSEYKEHVNSILLIYDILVKSSLSKSYSGIPYMYKGELRFRIKETTGLSGEAVETLALVLADVAAMVCSCKGIGHHPRFLLHDSPREADLDRRIYNRYLCSMWDLTQEYGGPDSAPFQYIVTTTSRPPEATEQAIRLKLKAHPPESMLFGRLLTNPPMEETPDVFAEVPST